MRTLSLAVLALAATLGAAPPAAHAGTVVKPPDGPGIAALGSNFSSVYANSFVAPNDGNVTEMGVWLRNVPDSQVRFEVYDSPGGDPGLGPDSTRLLARSPVDGGTYADFTFVDFDHGITDFGTLAAGHTYWLAATVVGLGDSGAYAVATHTQNTGGIVDNGTFWWSNDPAGRVFEGPWAPPLEIAFSVTVSPVPEPGALAMLALGLPLLAARARRGRPA